MILSGQDAKTSSMPREGRRREVPTDIPRHLTYFRCHRHGNMHYAWRSHASIHMRPIVILFFKRSAESITMLDPTRSPLFPS